MSWATFRRVWRAVVPSCMRIRQRKGDHAVCSVCTGYQAELRRYRTRPVALAEAAERLTQHLASQWLDRQVYWRARDVSRHLAAEVLKGGQLMVVLALETSMVCLISDAIDQAKFKIPRAHTKTKALENVYRPQCHVHGVWSHGFSLELAVSDQDQKKNTATHLECLAHSLSTIFVACGNRLPPGTWFCRVAFVNLM